MESYPINISWSDEFSFVFSVEDYWLIFACHLITANEAGVSVRKSRKKSCPKEDQRETDV